MRMPNTNSFNPHDYLPRRCGYRCATADLPPMDMQAPFFIEYVLAGNGLFARAVRREMEVCVPVARAAVGGLPPLQPALTLRGPKVPAQLVLEILARSRVAAPAGGEADEQIFFLHLVDRAWQLHVPPQEASAYAVQTTLAADDLVYSQAVLEVHSHHNMDAFFSSIDDREEAGKVRLFAVLGRVNDRPRLVARVGVWAYFMPVPVAHLFELPEELRHEPAARVD